MEKSLEGRKRRHNTGGGCLGEERAPLMTEELTSADALQQDWAWCA